MIAERIEDPEQLILTSFVALAIPGFLLGLAGLFGRDGDDLPMSWPGRAAGALAALLTFLTIRGVFNDRLGLVVLFASPAVLWWVVTSAKAWNEERHRPPEDDEDDEDDESEDDPDESEAEDEALSEDGEVRSDEDDDGESVSYTHLTLPTIYSV